MSVLLSEFDKFPEEKALIGEMLMSYGEIEFALVGCISEALSVSHHISGRIFFRVQGEGARLAVSDAILRPVFLKHKLQDQWIAAYAASRFCKGIRNQYAHCHWMETGGQLQFMDLDDDAKTNGEFLTVAVRPIDLSLIRRQHEYFEYAQARTYFLLDRLKRALGKPGLDSEPFPEPKSIPQPPRDNRPAKDAPIPPEARSRTF